MQYVQEGGQPWTGSGKSPLRSQLRTLKQLFDDKLISEAVYTQKQYDAINESAGDSIVTIHKSSHTLSPIEQKRLDDTFERALQNFKTDLTLTTKQPKTPWNAIPNFMQKDWRILGFEENVWGGGRFIFNENSVTIRDVEGGTPGIVSNVSWNYRTNPQSNARCCPESEIGCGKLLHVNVG
jgi:hypothetical protein